MHEIFKFLQSVMWFTDRAKSYLLSFVNNKEIRVLLNLFAEMCIMPSTLPGNLHCPREHTNHIAQQCVAKYITANTCKAAGGRWTNSSQTLWREPLEF